MKNSYSVARVLLCACIAAPGLALAQAMPAVKNTSTTTTSVTAPATASVTDPTAAVPPVVYQSVFSDTSTGVEMESADWKKANAEVGQFKRGHADILKWDEAQTKAPSAPTPMAGDPAKPATASASPSASPSTAPSQSSPLPTSPAARSTPTPSTPSAPSVHKH